MTLRSDGRAFFVLLMAVAVVTGCREAPQAPEPDPAAGALLPLLMAQYPEPVSISPDGRYLLVKTRHPRAFEIAVLERESGRVVATDRSSDTQLSLTWRPDSGAILFQECEGGNVHFRFHELDLETGRRRVIQAPTTYSAEPPLRWAPSGESFACLHFDGAEARLLLIEAGRPSASVAPKPRRLARHVLYEADFGWSPDGKQIATVPDRRPGALLLIDVATGNRRQVPVLERGILRDLAWSPAGDEILVTARREEDEYFTLWLVSLKTGRVSLLLESEGDVESPLWIENSRAALVQQSSRGAVELVHLDLETRETRRLGPARGITLAQGLSEDETRAFVLHHSEESPPALGSVSLLAADEVEVYYQAGAGQLPGIAPESLRLRNSEETSLPAYLWRAPLQPGRPARAVILVHGGPHGHTPPVWDAANQLLLLNGISILAVNYRGSTGYGASYEAAGDWTERVQDVETAVEEARRLLGVSPENLILVGVSYGTTLAARAALSPAARPGCLVLLSMVSTPELAASPGGALDCVLAFQGENDPIFTPRQARPLIRQLLGSEALEGPKSRWQIFEGEGHVFHRTASLASVYSKILEYYGREQAP